MKKRLYILIGVVLFLCSITFMVVNNSKESANKEKESTEQTSKQHHVNEKEKPSQIVSNTDVLNKMPAYIEEGESCYEIEDIIDRGDCFGDIHSSHSLWIIDQSKDTFYYSFHHDQDHWKKVFYVDVLENDELSEVVHTEDFKNYTDVLGFSDSQDERGTKLLHDFWYVFSSLVPQENREILTDVSWYDTGEDYVLAVGISEENVDERLLIVSHNLVHYVSNIKRLLLHEYAHMFTLADDQILLDEELAYSEDEEQWKLAEEECETLFSAWGCLREDSYMYSFYNEFWEDIDEDYQAIDWDDGEGYEDFFFRHEDRFYNSYQGTSIEEDIAETFTFFIIQPSEVALQAEEIKDEKIAFFYEYEELIHLRTEILENLFELNKKDGEFY